MVIQSKSIEIAEFEVFIARPENKDRLFELINGEIVEKMPTQKHGMLALKFGSRVLIHVETYKLGRVGVEVRYGFPGDKHNDRLPDISFTIDTTKPIVEEGPVPVMPDLAVEIKSPTDSFKKMREKARYYLAHGSRLVWLLFPEQKVIEVYTPDDEYVLGEGETLIGGDVLPGFSIPVSEVFNI